MKKSPRTRDELMKRVATIYLLTDPQNGRTRYVGHSVEVEKRYKRHITQAISGHKSHKSAWIRQLLRSGFMPVLDILETVPRSRAHERERWWIKELLKRGCDLTNHTVGGEGGLPWNAGLRNVAKLSKPRRAGTGEKISRALLKVGVWNKGKTKKTDLRIAASAAKTSRTLMGHLSPLKGKKNPGVSAALKGHAPWNKGLTMDDERVARTIHAMHRGQKLADYGRGKVGWSAGLTKDTDERVRRAAESRCGWADRCAAHV